MNLIKKIANFFLNNNDEREQEKIKRQELRLKNEAEIERSNVIKQNQVDRIWEFWINEKATERYLEIIRVEREGGLIMSDVTRPPNVYVIHDSNSARFKGGFEKAINEKVQKMLSVRHKIPKGTIPRLKP